MPSVERRYWTSWEERILLEMFESGGSRYNVAAIAEALRRTERAVRQHILGLRAVGRLKAFQHTVNPKPERNAHHASGFGPELIKGTYIRRPCLRCKKDFKSEGAHDRLCPQCGGLGEFSGEGAVVKRKEAYRKGRSSQIIIKSIVIAAYKDAPWAPVVTGFEPDWAWRVETENNNVVTGTCKGNQKSAISKAQAAAQRMVVDAGKFLPFIIASKKGAQ